MRLQYKQLQTTKRSRFLMLVIVSIILFFFSILIMDIDIAEFIDRAANTPEVLERMMGIDTAIFLDLLDQTLLTFFLVIISLTFALIFSLVFAFLAADNTAPINIIATIIKMTIAIIRSIPDLILGLVIIASIGFGNTPAILIMTMIGTAQLTRFFIGSIEEVGYDPIEAIRATGASWIQMVVHGVFPIVLAPFLSWVTIQVENTISLSISLGVLGIQGIGALLSDAQRGYKFVTITTIIIYIFILMFILEFVMTRVREKING